ncbi:DUF2829 domain-containing protein [uncultured Fusobacterium sp.]|uniref:DUF2829 domain-containing protein n=1 Tax=uncultured Fusobacterium sp. TaxID=159267 RepID=UPI0028047A23|nr:DUF2829 domain-containing protein [uncultured Fusobacterium sp.]
MNFGKALEELKRGKAIARSGWNGKRMFVYLVTGGAYPAQMEIAKQIEKKYGEVRYNPYMAIKNMNGTVSTWVPSVNDCLADDWYAIKSENTTENEMPDYILRMEEEFQELISKLQKARDFLEKEMTTSSDKTNEIQRQLLAIQVEHMFNYSKILNQRIYLEKKNK